MITREPVQGWLKVYENYYYGSFLNIREFVIKDYCGVGSKMPTQVLTYWDGHTSHNAKVVTYSMPFASSQIDRLSRLMLGKVRLFGYSEPKNILD